MNLPRNLLGEPDFLLSRCNMIIQKNDIYTGLRSSIVLIIFLSLLSVGLLSGCEYTNWLNKLNNYYYETINCFICSLVSECSKLLNVPEHSIKISIDYPASL